MTLENVYFDEKKKKPELYATCSHAEVHIFTVPETLTLKKSQENQVGNNKNVKMCLLLQ